MRAVTPDAIRLFHEGALALSKVESAGIRIDMEYVKRAVVETEAKIKGLIETLKKDEVWERWRRRFGQRASLGSLDQLATILFGEMGFRIRGLTKTGKAKVSEDILRTIDLPFIDVFLRFRKLQKAYSTYFKAILRETQDGILRPSFSLHLVDTYRSSSQDPNFQNIPIRDAEVGKLIRQSFIGRWFLAELDFSQVEVRVAECYNHDPVLLNYILDPTTDMHWDTAKKLFRLPPGETIGHHKKGTRDSSKNEFVFPQFYGSYYADCARAIWKSIENRGFTLDDGTPIKDHLARLGITERGSCDDSRPRAGTFEKLVQEVENWMWHEQYTVYTRWKKSWWNEYLKTGQVWMHTGFVCNGVYRRNQVINLPIQGSAFHLLLWTIIELQKWLDKYQMKSRIVGQIHDCLLVDCPDNELQDVLTHARYLMTVAIRKAWKWIIVPLETETDVVVPGNNWHQKSLWVQDGSGTWAPKKNAEPRNEPSGPASIRVSEQVHKGRK